MRVALLLALVAAACGGSSTAPVEGPADLEPVETEPPEDTGPAPLEVAARALREKNLLRVDVEAVARDSSAYRTIEEPALWIVEAAHGGAPLRRLVIGPAKVRREPLEYNGRWDVTVRFAVYFDAPPEQVEVVVRVVPPGGQETAFQSEIAASDVPPPPPPVVEPPPKKKPKAKKRRK